MEVRSGFGYDADKVSDETALNVFDVSKTLQSFRDDADINTLVKRFGITGEVPVNLRLPMQGDFSGVKDYKSAMDALIQADETFMELPADVRSKFNHDPQEFMSFVLDPANGKALVDMKLAKAPDVRGPVEVRVVPPAEPPVSAP